MNQLQLLKTLLGNPPFPWQERLLLSFSDGQIPTALDIPTGLGKTTVMAIWLAARASGASVPRRLFYIVDRRAVVDQATQEALRLRQAVGEHAELKAALGISRALPISTLRGQHVDNREWIEDPTSPTIIVGTIDMIGSRLLFEGYGVSRKMRPFLAGLIGVDTLVVLDEAHLVPPFEGLLETISSHDGEWRPSGEDRWKIIPVLKLLSLSATGRGGRKVFGLGEADYAPGTKTYQRLTAVKRLSFKPLEADKKLSQALAEEAWALTENGTQNSKIVVFCDKREDADAAMQAVEKLAGGDKKKEILKKEIHRELFVGGRRVRERQTASQWLECNSFLAGVKSRPEIPTFLFATSAGEVGVDLDADHMVCDLVAWERMVQRLGRVNRRGEGQAKIVVIPKPNPKPSKAAEKALAKSPGDRDKKERKAVADYEAQVDEANALGKPFELLSECEGGIDVSPAALQQLRKDADSDEQKREILSKATSPVPLRPGLTRPVVDAWAMTSLKEHTGRPRVQPWLRGWIEDEPQTTVVWRTHMPFVKGDRPTPKNEIEEFFEAAPPHTSEILEIETRQVMAWLKKRAALATSEGRGMKEANGSTPDVLNLNDPCAVVLENDGTLRDEILKLQDFAFSDGDKKTNQRREQNIERQLRDAILIIDARFAGLGDKGLFNHTVSAPPTTLDGYGDPAEWLPPIDGKPAIRFRVCPPNTTEQTDPSNSRNSDDWKPRLRMAIEQSEHEPPKWLIVEKWGWDIATADDGGASHWQALNEHQQLTAAKARDIAERLGLPDEYVKMLEIAARLHDEGKRHDKWQNAFNARLDGRPYAKTPGPINQALLDGYRHEFASVEIAKDDPELKTLPHGLQELALHLIAAHHGFARPNISTSGCPDAPPSLLQERAREVALRFARLQRQWGPWALAWWESLLRAADQQASRELEQRSKGISSHG